MDISIIEIVVYLFVELFSLSMLIISVVKETPVGKSQSIVRSMWLIPGIIIAGILMTAGPTVTMNDGGSQVTEVYNGTTGILMTNTTSYPATPNTIILADQTFWAVHLMIFIILLVYVVIQMLTLLTKFE